jgi:hypothetical protein
MALGWKSYARGRFTVKESIAVTPTTDFPARSGYHYVIARIDDPHEDDEHVIAESYHIINFPNLSTNPKAWCPNPPFQTGESTAAIKGYKRPGKLIKSSGKRTSKKASIKKPVKSSAKRTDE